MADPNGAWRRGIRGRTRGPIALARTMMSVSGSEDEVADALEVRDLLEAL